MCVCLQLCKAGLKTLQDLGPEMRLALNEDLDEDEEEVMMEDEELEENAAYKVVYKNNNCPLNVSEVKGHGPDVTVVVSLCVSAGGKWFWTRERPTRLHTDLAHW